MALTGRPDSATWTGGCGPGREADPMVIRWTLAREAAARRGLRPGAASMNFLNEVAQPVPRRDLARRRPARSRSSSPIADIDRYLDRFSPHLRRSAG